MLNHRSLVYIYRSLNYLVLQNSIQKGKLALYKILQVKLLIMYSLIDHKVLLLILTIFLIIYREAVANFLKALCVGSGIDCYDLLTAVTGICFNHAQNELKFKFVT